MYQLFRVRTPHNFWHSGDMDLDSAAKWSEREAVEIEAAKEVRVCRYLGVDVYLL